MSAEDPNQEARTKPTLDEVDLTNMAPGTVVWGRRRVIGDIQHVDTLGLTGNQAPGATMTMPRWAVEKLLFEAGYSVVGTVVVQP